MRRDATWHCPRWQCFELRRVFFSSSSNAVPLTWKCSKSHRKFCYPHSPAATRYTSARVIIQISRRCASFILHLSRACMLNSFKYSVTNNTYYDWMCKRGGLGSRYLDRAILLASSMNYLSILLNKHQLLRLAFHRLPPSFENGILEICLLPV